MRSAIAATGFLLLLLVPVQGRCLEMANHLILQDIGTYRMDRPDTALLGEPPTGGPQESPGAGVLTGTGHFPDHADVTYEVLYRGGPGTPSPVVTVTRHAGSESDQWLLHEIETVLRGSGDDDSALGSLHSDASVMTIGNSTILRLMGVFTWVSKNVVVEIEGDFVQTGPLDVVWAYVQKIPSTIPATMALDEAHDAQWIKDEMERRLWLAGKWFTHLRTNKTLPKKALKEAVASMDVFLEYREKYYGIRSLEEQRLLAGLQEESDDNRLFGRLKDYRKWWSKAKDRPLKI